MDTPPYNRCARCGHEFDPMPGLINTTNLVCSRCNGPIRVGPPKWLPPQEDPPGTPYEGDDITLPDGRKIANDGTMRVIDDPLKVVLGWLREWEPPRLGVKVLGVRPGPFPAERTPPAIKDLKLTDDEFTVLMDIDDRKFLLPFSKSKMMHIQSIYARLDRCVAEHSGPGPYPSGSKGRRKRRR